MIARLLRYGVIGLYLLIASAPLLWMGLTSIKPKAFAEQTTMKVVPAFGSEAYAGIDLQPPEAVIANAKAGLAAYAANADDVWGQGLDDERGMRVAKALAAAQPLVAADMRVVSTWMRNNQKRLKKDSEYASKGPPFQDWQGRGGDAGFAWMDKLVGQIDAADERWRQGISFPPTVAGYTELNQPIVSTDENTYFDYLFNSIIIGFISTVAAVLLGTSTAYGFSRFKIAGSKDWLFFILSTRFMPPLAVVVPILLMYRHFDLPNTHLGLIILYTAFNLSLAVWLMKGFIDEIPQAYEEAALVDGYSRWQAFYKIILPQSLTGMAVTAVFCLISAWNEYGFAQILNGVDARTVPVFFAGLQGNIHGVPWHKVAAGSLLFVVPIVVFVILVRRHLLRGVTFGTVKG